MNEMEVQKLEKGIFIGDSATASHMTSDMTHLYNLQKRSGSVMIGNGQNIDAPIQDCWMSFVSKMMVNCKRHMGNKSCASIQP